ncbi:Dyp-type peroxidase [Vibrio sp. SM6]|uniref:Dyp-type peroxidase n=1 Tax=Vibrio agarilyticus TaxID=2726741 RepID=A0A7X8YFE8_9VIBR|nr:Dyp-type peroxidase [Vibrio agarilyticus]NLS11828.1 Dyp-type peroxidase [Vibrio agarilyticus]
MTHLAALAQPGVLSDPSTHADFLTFVLRDQWFNVEEIGDALGQLGGIEKSLRHKDDDAHLTVTIGFSKKAWEMAFPDTPLPPELADFVEMTDGDRHFPSTAGDIFIMVKSSRMDLNFQVAKYCATALSPIAELIEDTQGYRYLDNRDMIDFVDGTENPEYEQRASWVLVGDGDDAHVGGSYLTVQRYIDRQGLWDAQSTEYQEQVVGRTKLDDIELSDDDKPAWAHNAKSKVIVDDEEIKMFRQNRPYGNAIEHGTMFVGFVASASTLTISLTQMITADEEGHYDRLLDFVEAKTGNNFFVPPRAFLEAQFDD